MLTYCGVLGARWARQDLGLEGVRKSRGDYVGHDIFYKYDCKYSGSYLGLALLLRGGDDLVGVLGGGDLVGVLGGGVHGGVGVLLDLELKEELEESSEVICTGLWL